jgi:hypothetical protein
MALHGALAAQLPGEKVAHGLIAAASMAATSAIVTGLESIRFAQCQMVGIPDSTHWISVVASVDGGTLNLAHYKPTTAWTDMTPIASTTPWNPVYWIAIGQGAR